MLLLSELTLMYAYKNNYCADFKKDSIKYPKYTSFGIIPFIIIDGNIHFVLVQRKETISFILFTKNKLQKLNLNPEEEISKMTVKEKNYLLDMIEWTKRKNFNSEMYSNIEKYKDYLMHNSHGELEWFFPKGRRNNSYEPPCITAIREFYEETQFVKCIKQIYVNNPINCFKYGTDKKKYNYVLFPALIDIDVSRKIMNVNSDEISNIGIFNKDEMKYKVDMVIPNLYEKIIKEINNINLPFAHLP